MEARAGWWQFDRAVFCASSLRLVVIMVPVFALLIAHLFFGGCSGLLHDIGRRKNSPHLSQDALDAFELRLLTMFGLKQRPSPSRTAVVPQYMLDLFTTYSANSAELKHHKAKSTVGRSADRSASRANTVRSFHHDGKPSPNLSPMIKFNAFMEITAGVASKWTAKAYLGTVSVLPVL